MRNYLTSDLIEKKTEKHRATIDLPVVRPEAHRDKTAADQVFRHWATDETVS